MFNQKYKNIDLGIANFNLSLFTFGIYITITMRSQKQMSRTNSPTLFNCSCKKFGFLIEDFCL